MHELCGASIPVIPYSCQYGELKHYVCLWCVSVSVQSLLKEVIVRLAFPISGVGLMERFSFFQRECVCTHATPPPSFVIPSVSEFAMSVCPFLLMFPKLKSTFSIYIIIQSHSLAPSPRLCLANFIHDGHLSETKPFKIFPYCLDWPSIALQIRTWGRILELFGFDIATLFLSLPFSICVSG